MVASNEGEARMTPNHFHSDPHLVDASRRFAAVAAVITALAGALALAGWALNLGLLKSLVAGPPTIKPLTALGLLLAGTALWLLGEPAATGQRRQEGWQRRLGLICAGAVAVLGGLTLLESLPGIDPGINQALLADSVAPAGGPMPAAALCLLLLGVALLTLDRKPGWLAPAGMLLVLLVSGLALLGTVYEETTIGQIGPYLPVAPGTALGMLALALGVLASRPEGSLMRTLTTPLTGGTLGRRMLPAAVLLPCVLGWLRLLGQRQGLLDIGFGGALFAAGNVVVFGGLVYWTARVVNRAEARREAINAALRESGENLRQLNAELEARVEQRTAALAASEAKFRTLFNVLPVGVSILDPQRRMVQSNPALSRIMRLSDEGLASGAYTSRRFIHPDGRPMPMENYASTRAFEEQRPVLNVETGVETESGETIWVDVSAAPLPLEGLGVVVVTADISNRKRAEADLQAANARFQFFVDANIVGVTRADEAGNLFEANDYYLDLLGYSRQDLEAGLVNWKDSTPPEYLPAEAQTIADLRARGVSKPLEKEYVRRDGSRAWVYLSSAMQPDGTIAAFILNITERKLAEQALARERDLMQALMDNIPDTIYFKDTASRFTRINRAQAEYLRLPSPQAAFGKTDLDFQKSAYAQDSYDEEQRLVMRGQPLLNRIDLVAAPDGQPRWISSTKVPLKDEDGRVVGLVGISRDITAVKQAEAQLVVSLQEKDVLLKEIHHRVKNNLQVVSSLLHLQAESLDDPQLRDAFDDSQRRVRSMALIHEQLYRSQDLAHIDFGEYINGLLTYLRRSQARPGDPLHTRVEIDHVTLEIDRAIPLGLMVNELVTNSLKYAFPPGPARADRAGVEADEIWVAASRDATGALTLVVGDNGVGIPDSVDLNQPVSMGWQLVQSFVTQLHGRSSLQRRPGAVFTLTLPERKDRRG